MVVFEISLERHKPNFLQHHVSPGIGQHFLFDSVPARHARIGELVGRRSRFDRKVAEGTMTFIFREEVSAVGDNQAEVAGAGLVNTGKISLIEDAMTESEPNPAVEIQRSAYASLGARGPAGFDSGPARRVSKIIIIVIAHRGSSSPPSSLAEDADLCSISTGNAGKAHLIEYMSGWRFIRVLPRLGPRAKRILVTAFAMLVLRAAPRAVADLPSAGLDRGFGRLYDLDFSGAQREFESWERLNPENPMGPASEAAGILFSEFDRLGVLEAQFYENDPIFAAPKKYAPSPRPRARFHPQLTPPQTSTT